MAEPQTVAPLGPNPSMPAIETEPEVILVADDTATTAQYVAAPVIDVRAWRELTLFLNVDANAAADRLGLKIKVSNAVEKPAAGDDSWYLPLVTDGSVTPGAGFGAVAAGADETLLPADWGVIFLRQGEYRLSAFTGATEELRPALELKVSRYRWVLVEYNDGGGATRCKVGIRYARSC